MNAVAGGTRRRQGAAGLPLRCDLEVDLDLGVGYLAFLLRVGYPASPLRVGLCLGLNAVCCRVGLRVGRS